MVVDATMGPGPSVARGTARRGQEGRQEPLFGRAHDLELFTGAGGLSLGLAAAGFIAEHLFEKNARACATLKANKERGAGVRGEVHSVDVRDVDWSKIPTPVRLLAAGPPCQPFSLAGNHKGDQDHRNEFPATLRAVRELRPEHVLLENVQGLVRPSFRKYFDYILLQLSFPSFAPLSADEDWLAHLERLTCHADGRAPEYIVRWRVLNAADYGVPQLRTRTVIIASRADRPVVELPAPTHSRTALLVDQAAGTYWERHRLEAPSQEGPRVDPEELRRDPSASLLPWRTVRDALSDLRAPGTTDADPLQHWIIPGARLYRGHRGSVLDWPSKTIKAGVHGVAGGENIVHLDDGSFRYFTLREMARIQGFPDTYAFEGPRSRIIGQIGNAVPFKLAEALGRQINAAIATMDVASVNCATSNASHRGTARHAG